MKIDEFDYDLPKDLIAQTPLKKRDDSRLMIMDKKSGAIKHEVFSNIIDYLQKDDVLVINDTKVIPARLIGEKLETKAVIELLLLKDLSDNIWQALAKPLKRLKIGTIISFGDGLLKAEVVEIIQDGIINVKLIYDGILMEILDRLGVMPLPPYIHQKLEDKNRYQTVYAKNIGSSAAPTAGLHFTGELLDKIKSKDVIICAITLHVGLGTFRPVNTTDITKHQMHSEYYSMSEETAAILNNAKMNHHNIYAVGTTSTRALETIIHKYGTFKQTCGNTQIFIYPGFEFQAIDGLITNFHLPKSTLLMLVSALSTKENILNAYQVAIENKYRFFSFGDAMFIK